MRNFLKYLLLILIITLSLMVLLDGLYTFAFHNSPPRNKIHSLLQTENKHYDYALFGSSRTESHIDCELFEKLTGKSCINMGVAGSSLGDMAIILKIAREQNFTFDHALIQLDNNFNQTGTTDYVISNLLPFINNPVVEQEILKEPKGYLYSNIPFYRYMAFDKVIGQRELGAAVLGRKSTIDLSNGFWPLSHDAELVPARFPDMIVDINPDLQKSVEIILEEGATPVFFTSPYCSKAVTDHYMFLLEEKFPDLYNYINLFEDKQEYFADCGHLNKTGAQAFTKQLVEDLKQNMVIQ